MGIIGNINLFNATEARQGQQRLEAARIGNQMQQRRIDLENQRLQMQRRGQQIKELDLQRELTPPGSDARNQANQAYARMVGVPPEAIKHISPEDLDKRLDFLSKQGRKILGDLGKKSTLEMMGEQLSMLIDQFNASFAELVGDLETPFSGYSLEGEAGRATAGLASTQEAIAAEIERRWELQDAATKAGAQEAAKQAAKRRYEESPAEKLRNERKKKRHAATTEAAKQAALNPTDDPVTYQPRSAAQAAYDAKKALSRESMQQHERASRFGLGGSRDLALDENRRVVNKEAFRGRIRPIIDSLRAQAANLPTNKMELAQTLMAPFQINGVSVRIDRNGVMHFADPLAREIIKSEMRRAGLMREIVGPPEPPR